MTVEPVAIDNLIAARTDLVAGIVGNIPDQQRRFLVSFESGKPDWDLLGLPRIDKLPAIQCREQNPDKITKNRRAHLVAQLERVLGLVVTPT